ncbi:MAG: TonB family protein [Desulfobacteraceae bacterium]
MKVALAASAVLHCLALLAFQEAFPSFLEIPEARLYRIDLIRPPVEELPDQENPSGDSADYRKQEEPDPPEKELREDTISLDTKDRRYVDYASAVKERLMEQWVYPEKARELLLEGRLLLVFTLSRSGDTAGMEVLQSSGHTVLDREACRAVRAASPFPAFPEHLNVHRLHIRASFDYRLTQN